MGTDKNEELSWLTRLENIPAKWLYVLIAIVAFVPFFVPMGFPVFVTPMTRTMFEDFEALEPGDAVLYLDGSNPRALVEFERLNYALIQYLFLKPGVKLYIVSMARGGTNWGMLFPIVDILENPLNKEYGTDYVYLPWVPGSPAVNYPKMAQDFPGFFRNKDNFGTPLDQLSAMEGINTIEDFKFIWTSGMGDGGTGNIARYIIPRYPDTIAFVAHGAGSQFGSIPWIGAGIKAGLWGVTGAKEFMNLYDWDTPLMRAETDVFSAYSVVTLVLLVITNIRPVYNALKRVGGR